MQEYDLQFVHISDKQLMIADRFSRISHFKFSTVKKSEYIFSEFAVISTNEKKWKRYLVKK